MTEYIKTNYGLKTECILCGQDDSTEHIFVCPSQEKNTKVSIKNLEEGTKMKEIVSLFKTTEERRKKKMRDLAEEEIERICNEQR